MTADEIEAATVEELAETAAVSRASLTVARIIQSDNRFALHRIALHSASCLLTNLISMISCIV